MFPKLQNYRRYTKRIEFGDRIIGTMCFMLLFSCTIGANYLGISIVGDGNFVPWFCVALAIWAGISLVIGALFAFIKEKGSPMFFDIIRSWFFTDMIGLVCGTLTASIVKACHNNIEAGISVTSGDAGVMIAVTAVITTLMFKVYYLRKE